MLISIITINYNNKEGLSHTMESVKKQSFQNFEHIIIDGASNDGSKKIIEANTTCLSYWISEKDSGIYNAMNKGIKVSNGDYLLFLNSGDTLFNTNTLAQVADNLRSGKDVYYGNLELIHKMSREVKVYPDELSFSFFYNKGHIPHPASFINRALFDEVYFYKENLKIVSDWDFFVCAICKYNASYQHIDLVVSNYTTDGVSSDPKHFKDVEEERQQSIEENFPLFISDMERLISSDKDYELNRFKMLKALEESRIAQKLNSFWLNFLTKLFNKPFD